MMSDVFVEMRHFQWVSQTFGELLPSPGSGGAEDELLLQYLVIGLCRAAAVCHAVSQQITC